MLDTKSKTRVVLIGSFGAGNIGDELILAGFLAELKRRMPKAIITVLGGREKCKTLPTGRQVQNAKGKISFLPLLPIGLRSLLNSNWLASLKAIRKADLVIFPGGGLFTDEESLRAPLLWALHIFVARFFWKPVHLFGQSVGPFKTDFGGMITSKALSLVNSVTTRDKASLKELRELGVPLKNTQLGRDSALLLQNPRRIKKLPKKIRSVLVSVRDYPRLPANFWKDLIKLLECYIDQGVKIEFALLDAADQATFQKLKLLNPKIGKIKLLELPNNALGLINLVAKYDLVIGMRLHSLVVSHLAGVPSIGIAYSRKVSEFQKNIGQRFVLPEEIIKSGILSFWTGLRSSFDNDISVIPDANRRRADPGSR